MRNQVLSLLFIAVAILFTRSEASTFVLLEPSFGKYGQGLQISYFSMNTLPGLKLAVGAGFSYMDVDGGSEDLDGSLIMVMPGVTVRYLTPYWLMPELEAVVNLGYESYTQCGTTACSDESDFVVGGTLRQKVLLVPSFRFSPVVGVGLFETYNFRSKLYPHDIGFLLSAGVKF